MSTPQTKGGLDVSIMGGSFASACRRGRTEGPAQGDRYLNNKMREIRDAGKVIASSASPSWLR